MLVSVAIPVYRNAGSLTELHDRIVASFQAMPGIQYQIVFADDGSDDGSVQELMEIKERDPHVWIIKLSRNFGQHAANNAAFQYVSGDIVINMSADLQDPPEIISAIVDKISQGYDIILATRERVHERPLRRLTSWIHYRLVRISVPSYPPKGFDFWGANRKAFDAFMSFNDVVRRNQIDLLSIGFKVGHVTYTKGKRRHGASQYTFFKRLDIALSQILATATWPLRFASALGILFTVTGGIYAIYLFTMYFFRDVVYPGWTAIMMLLLIIGGVMMFMLGIIGEYLWRIFYETKRRPLFFVDQVIPGSADLEHSIGSTERLRPRMARAVTSQSGTDDK